MIKRVHDMQIDAGINYLEFTKQNTYEYSSVDFADGPELILSARL